MDTAILARVEDFCIREGLLQPGASQHLAAAVSGGADSKTGYIKGNDVRLRSGAGTSYSILGTYNNGTPLTITGTSGDWTAVTINGV
uniref:SH3 domain-containing protein n=1 Tax=Faecalibacterium prausnitzii TaxID=853 RepID=UPI0040263821